ncbi:MAG: alpha/beta hydrolase [Pseudomonadota bacterium]
MTYAAKIHDGEEGGPLLLALHATGGDESQFFDLARGFLPQAKVVSPRGDVSEQGAARFFRRTGEGVYDMADLSRAIEKMATFVRSFRHDGPVFGFGYSNGANILAATQMAHPDLFDRVGLLHPLIPWAPEPVDLSGKHVLLTAGKRDPITPWRDSERLRVWYASQGANVRHVAHDGGHELREQEIAGLAALLSDPVPA